MSQGAGGLDSGAPADGPIQRSARLAAQRLAAGYGSHLVPNVEAALHAFGSRQRSDQYLDPVALAALIVSAAQLAWTLYSDLKTQHPQPSREVLARRVRVELSEDEGVSPRDRIRVIEVVTDEVVRDAEASRDQ